MRRAFSPFFAPADDEDIDTAQDLGLDSSEDSLELLGSLDPLGSSESLELADLPRGEELLSDLWPLELLDELLQLRFGLLL